eukprot:gene1594-gene1749
MICSSRSTNRWVKAIMMSRCFSNNCLYRSTCAFSSSMFSRSRSKSANLNSYCWRNFSCCCFIVTSTASSPPLLLPPRPPGDIDKAPFGRSPRNICDVNDAIRCSNFFFSSFSRKNSNDFASNSLIAAILSASARRRCSSSSNNRRLSTTFLLRSSSSARNFFNSCSYFRNNDFWSKSSLTRASLRMFLARLANFKVEIVSIIASNAGEIIAIMVVLQLPPNESSNIRVSLLLRYGICARSPFLVKAEMTKPNIDNDLLICFDSSNRCPVAPERFTRSEPAKSTKFNLPTLK